MPGTRSQGTPLQPLVPEIDRHYHQLRKQNLAAVEMGDVNENTPRVNGAVETPVITYGTYMQPGEI